MPGPAGAGQDFSGLCFKGRHYDVGDDLGYLKRMLSYLCAILSSAARF